MSTIRINIAETARFTEVCANLVKGGVIFNATLNGSDWLITFTGGF